MALFGNSTKKTTASTNARLSVADVRDAQGNLSTVLTAPWLSEKALIGTEKGVYVFQVSVTATKQDIALAIEKTYKVVPRQVRVANVRGKKVSFRTRRGAGTRSARRKAYVYLKKGDTIQFA